ncbi:MAG: hypothetical protein ABI723_12460 [Bacteroidia bacterium]
MKNVCLSIILISLVASCTKEKLDLTKAKTVVENLVNTTNKEDYKNISQYYTDALNEGEPENVRIEKLQKLKLMLGNVESVTMVSTSDTLYNDQVALFLIYKIKHKKATSTQQFTVIKEKGEYKIARQDIESVN